MINGLHLQYTEFFCLHNTQSALQCFSFTYSTGGRPGRPDTRLHCQEQVWAQYFAQEHTLWHVENLRTELQIVISKQSTLQSDNQICNARNR